MVARQHGYRDWNTFAAARGALGASLAITDRRLPRGWDAVGHFMSNFSVSVVPEGGSESTRAICLSATSAPTATSASAWIAVRQQIATKRYRDRRVAFSVWLKGVEVGDKAFPWLRVDNALGQKTAYIGCWEAPAFVVTGSTTWLERKLVVDVPAHSASIEFGVTLNGAAGAVFASRMAFGETAEPLTALRTITAEAPENLDLA